VADISEKVNTTLSSSVALNVKTSDNWKGLVVSLVPTVKTAGSNTQTTTKTITTNYKYNSDNELVSSVKSGDGIANETSTYTYDKNGNMTSVTSGNTVKTYIWNSSNQLISVKLNNVTVAQFSYDALGNRIAKKGASIIRYVNDISTNANVITEMTNANVPTRMNIVGPLGQISTGDVGNTTRLYPIVDSIGSTRLLADSSGNIIQKYSFDDYGNKTTVDVVGKPSTQYQFAG
jgi:YD repeat-containing protein